MEAAPLPDCDVPGNYLPEACQGCNVVHKQHPRILGTSRVGPGAAPYWWDAETKEFSVANVSRGHTCFTFLSFSGVDVLDQHGEPFPSGVNRQADGTEESVTTFVVVAEPLTTYRLGRVAADAAFAGLFALPMERLAPPRPLRSPEPPGAPAAFGFPLPASHGPYLCTQGVGGHLTHFFPESYHAIDLRCACRTPVLCIGDGIVVDVEEENHVGGVHVGNLGKWNSVSVRLDCGLQVDYVHTLPGTAKVRKGDVVRSGQVLCESGDIGFAPEPHLHIELHLADNPDGPSVPLLFGQGLAAFLPAAGRWYAPGGEVVVAKGSAPGRSAVASGPPLPPGVEAAPPSPGCAHGQARVRCQPCAAE